MPVLRLLAAPSGKNLIEVYYRSLFYKYFTAVLRAEFLVGKLPWSLALPDRGSALSLTRRKSRMMEKNVHSPIYFDIIRRPSRNDTLLIFYSILNQIKSNSFRSNKIE